MTRDLQERLGERNLYRKSWITVITEPVMLAIAWTVTMSAHFAAVAPRLLVASLLVFFILAIPMLTQNTSKLKQSIRNPLFLTSLAFAGYALSSALWSNHVLTAIDKGLWLAFAIISVQIVPLLIKQMSDFQLHRCARGLALGLLIGMVYPVFEFATDNQILKVVTKSFPGLLENLDPTTQIANYQLNANATAIALFWWPAMMVTIYWKNIWAKKLSIVILSLSLAYLLYQTLSATAQFAFLVGGIAWLAAYVAPQKTDFLARTLWSLVVVGIVPIIMLIYFADIQNTTVLPYSFKDRIHIWHYTAKLVPENPVLGIGIRSSRHYTKSPAPGAAVPSKQNLVDRPGWHSHNLFLQTWYELGAIGAAFLLAIGLLLLRTIRQLDPGRRPFGYAIFASCSMVAAVGYGMWQSWLIAIYTWCFVFLLIGLRYENKASQT